MPALAVDAELARRRSPELLLSESAGELPISSARQDRPPSARGFFEHRGAEAARNLLWCPDARRLRNSAAARLAAMGALVAYLDHVGGPTFLQSPVRHLASGRMAIDAATRESLELVRTMAGAREGSLLGTIDRTVTAFKGAAACR